MTLTRRGKWTATATAILAVAATVLGFLVVTGKAPALIRRAAAGIGIGEPPPPPTCPLTGEPAPSGVVPDRPALAVKVENLAEARPQAGIEGADIVYEEPVEGGITRFVVLYQCHDAPRVGPVRSGRITDPGILVQYGTPLLGYSGGANRVRRAIDEAGLVDVSEMNAIEAYVRDPDRVAPHDLFAGTKKLYAAGRSKDGAPDPIFAYGEDLPERSRKARTVHLFFSSSADVFWTWDRREGLWLRSHGDVPHTLESGDRVSAANVVVQVVEVTAGTIVDAAGNASPEVTLTGRGRAYVFRNGRMIVGRWVRDTLADRTTFVTKAGEEIALAPGTTWIELLPSTVPVETSR